MPVVINGFVPVVTKIIINGFVPVDCVLYDILKDIRFPVWNDLKFCLTDRWTDRLKQLLYCECACVLGMRFCPICQIQSTAKLQVHVSIHVLTRIVQCSKC